MILFEQLYKMQINDFQNKFIFCILKKISMGNIQQNLKEPLIIIPLMSTPNEHYRLSTHAKIVQQQLTKLKSFQQQMEYVQPNYLIKDCQVLFGEFNEHKLLNGLGKIIDIDGAIQAGKFDKGVSVGDGTIIFKDGSYFRGNFENNLPKGKGIYRTNQIQYRGQFLNGMFHGQGTQKSIDQNSVFAGNYSNGEKKKGKLWWRQKVGLEFQYNGEFQDNKFHGNGTLKTMKGVYQGQFSNGLKHGKGTFQFSNGVKYIGQYKLGYKEGLGKIYSHKKPQQQKQQIIQNLSYSGEFKNGLPNGIGQIYDFQTKKLKKGTWKDGQCLNQIKQSVNI